MNYTGIKKLLAVSGAVPVWTALSAPVSNGTLDTAVPTAGSGETHDLQKSENLLSNDWVLVDSVMLSNAFSRFEDSINASASAFYRISVEP